jgi:ABC-type hemin transport system ATPase subunit
MISENEEVAKHQVADHLHVARTDALRRQDRATRSLAGSTGPRHQLAAVLRQLANRLEPQPRRRSTGLSGILRN